jgi:hypothetical protein
LIGENTEHPVLIADLVDLLNALSGGAELPMMKQQLELHAQRTAEKKETGANQYTFDRLPLFAIKLQQTIAKVMDVDGAPARLAQKESTRALHELLSTMLLDSSSPAPSSTIRTSRSNPPEIAHNYTNREVVVQNTLPQDLFGNDSADPLVDLQQHTNDNDTERAAGAGAGLIDLTDQDDALHGYADTVVIVNTRASSATPTLTPTPTPTPTLSLHEDQPGLAEEQPDKLTTVVENSTITTEAPPPTTVTSVGRNRTKQAKQHALNKSIRLIKDGNYPQMWDRTKADVLSSSTTVLAPQYTPEEDARIILYVKTCKKYFADNGMNVELNLKSLPRERTPNFVRIWFECVCVRQATVWLINVVVGFSSGQLASLDQLYLLRFSLPIAPPSLYQLRLLRHQVNPLLFTNCASFAKNGSTTSFSARVLTSFLSPSFWQLSKSPPLQKHDYNWTSFPFESPEMFRYASHTRAHAHAHAHAHVHAHAHAHTHTFIRYCTS